MNDEHTTEQLTTDMTEEDWLDISESELVDIASSPVTDKIAFVFDHPEIGLHGFEYQPDNYHIRAVSYSRSDGDSAEAEA